jgi:hypothetical protein
VTSFRVLFRYSFEAVDEILQFLSSTPNSCECFEIRAGLLNECVILMLYHPAWKVIDKKCKEVLSYEDCRICQAACRLIEISNQKYVCNSGKITINN